MAGENSPTTKHPGAGSIKPRPPTTSILRSAMYYQNRIISAEPPQELKSRSPSSTHASSPATASEISARPEINQSPPNVKQTGAHETIAENSNSNNNRKTDPISVRDISNSGNRRCGNAISSGIMESRGIDIVITDTEDGSQRHELKKYTIWKKVSRALQDNRMKGKPDAERILAVGNPQDYRILKKVLNITFLTIGIALLIAVIIVIIYTYVGKFVVYYLLLSLRFWHTIFNDIIAHTAILNSQVIS